MDRETAYRMAAFADEIEKTAGLWDAFRAARSKSPGLLRGVGRTIKAGLKDRHGRQLMVGAGIGGVTGAVASEDEDRVRGALLGAGLGAGVAGARILATPRDRALLGKNLKSFGKRQWHFATGRGVPTAAEAERLKVIPKAPSKKEMRGALDETLDPRKQRKIKDKFSKDVARHQTHVQAFQKGETSLPGIFRSAVTHPVEFARRSWQRQDTPGKIFTGLSGVMAGRELMRRGEPGEEGRFARTGSEIGTGLGFLAVPHGLVPGLATSYLASKAGKYLGRGVDVLAGTKPPAAQPVGQVTPPTQLTEAGGA